MWIYYYASFGPGHQSNDYGFKYFADGSDMEGIKEHLFHTIDSNGYSIVLRFWEVENPPAKYVNNEIKYTKMRIKSLRKYLKSLESTTCFVPDEKEGEEDKVIKRNLNSCCDEDLLKRLHNAGFMYGADDINNWYYGKKYPTEPNRSKILKIMRRSKKYPSAKEQKNK